MTERVGMAARILSVWVQKLCLQVWESCPPATPAAPQGGVRGEGCHPGSVALGREDSAGGVAGCRGSSTSPSPAPLCPQRSAPAPGGPRGMDGLGRSHGAFSLLPSTPAPAACSKAAPRRIPPQLPGLLQTPPHPGMLTACQELLLQTAPGLTAPPEKPASNSPEWQNQSRDGTGRRGKQAQGCGGPQTHGRTALPGPTEPSPTGSAPHTPQPRTAPVPEQARPRGALAAVAGTPGSHAQLRAPVPSQPRVREARATRV